MNFLVELQIFKGIATESKSILLNFAHYINAFLQVFILIGEMPAASAIWKRALPARRVAPRPLPGALTGGKPRGRSRRGV